ncbi:hypothetical protein [Rhabdothermincola sediminis]|uniref:hypothetical protein n=1 Tax=Rhabdothermincola sediminis TaxID=2751370 RepID=UPI001AA03B1D|nr:hypothetical protein [Rhabdothermincola sediminis]
MANVDKYLAKYRSILQKAIPEPVEAVPLLRASGAGIADALMFASPLASAVAGRSARKQAGGLPKDMAIGLTATSFHVFGYKQRGIGIKLKGDPIIWPRRSVRFTPTGSSPTSPVTVELAETGQRMQLEQPVVIGGDINAEFFARLAGGQA